MPGGWPNALTVKLCGTVTGIRWILLGTIRLSNVASANFTQEEMGDIRLFYLPGGLCYEKMGTLDRFFMKLFRKMLASRKNPSAEEAETAKAISHSYDIADRAYLDPVMDAFMQSADF